MEHVENNSSLVNVDLERLNPPRFMLRIDLGNLDWMASSLRECGVIEPLIVRPSKDCSGKFEVICGLRRFMAAQKAGLKAVPCIVKEMDDCEAMEIMLTENLQREELSDYELGRTFKLLMEMFPQKYPSQHAVAEKFGYKDASIISRLIAHYEFLESLADAAPAIVLSRGKKLSERLTREIRRAPEELRPKLLGAIVKAFEKYDVGEAPQPPSARDIAMLVDSYIKSWQAKAVEKVAENAPAPAAPPTSLNSEEIEKPIDVKIEKLQAPEPTPSPPTEEKVREHLEQIMKKRREEARLKREEEIAITLYKYYPESFMRDIESFCGPGTPVERVQKLAYYAVEVAWTKFSDAEKLEIVREARSWLD